MRWDASPKAGFTSGEPWLPMGDAAGANVAAQRDDPASLFSFYRRLIRTRRASDALRVGGYRSIRAPRGVYAFERSIDRERVIVALNFTSAAMTTRLPNDDARVVLSTDDGREGPMRAGSLVLGPDEGVILSI